MKLFRTMETAADNGYKMLTYAVSHSNIPIKRTMLEELLREAFHE